MSAGDQTSMSLWNGMTVGLNAIKQIEGIAMRVKVVAKTASYTCKIEESGTVFTNRGAGGAVTFTLPTIADSAGVVFYFMNCVLAQDLTISAPSANMVAFNNITATSIAFSTASQRAGGGAMLVCDGVKWLAFVMANVGATVSIA
jgi:hypothetical protein